MGSICKPPKATLFVAVMYSDEPLRDQALRSLEERFGSVDFQFGPAPFDFTAYYGKEMGSGLQKWYGTFQVPIEREQLASIKVLTNELEARLATDDGNRRVNIDPGYLTNDKLVLASTKDFFHRIYLSKGIYAEVTLHFRKGRYRHFSWTYRDYRQPGFFAFLERARAKLVGESRKNK